MQDLFTNLYIIIMALVVLFVSFITIIHIVSSNIHEKELKELDHVETRTERRKRDTSKLANRKRHWFLRYSKQ